jgi:hypothetical protein
MVQKLNSLLTDVSGNILKMIKEEFYPENLISF